MSIHCRVLCIRRDRIRRATALGAWLLSALPLVGQDREPLSLDRESVAPASRPTATQPEAPEGLVSDRPDFTESSSVVPAGRLQIEMGYTYTSDRENGTHVQDQTFPEFLYRIGVVKDWELRVGWAGWSATETTFPLATRAGRRVEGRDHEDGATDLYVGFKWHIFDQRGWRPEFAIIPALNLPTGTRSKTGGDVDPEIKLAWTYDLTERASLAGNLNFASVTTEDFHRIFQTAASITVGYSLTDWMGTYVEYFGFYPNDRHTDCAHYLNGGLTFPVTPDLQFDVRVGCGLNEEADDFFTGFGTVIRI